MNIQKKIKEAMKRRHQNEAGFTLIELLVVILIIAILAAVAIAAFLSSLDSAKKSNATTLVRSVQSDVVSIMASNGTGDYSGIDANALKAAEKDIKFVADASVTANKNSVGIISVNGGLGLKIVAADNKNCYAAQMQPGIATIYEKTTTSACNTTALVATSSPTATDDNTDRQLTWK